LSAHGAAVNDDMKMLSSAAATGGGGGGGGVLPQCISSQISPCCYIEGDVVNHFAGVSVQAKSLPGYCHCNPAAAATAVVSLPATAILMRLRAAVRRLFISCSFYMQPLLIRAVLLGQPPGFLNPAISCKACLFCCCPPLNPSAASAVTALAATAAINLKLLHPPQVIAAAAARSCHVAAYTAADDDATADEVEFNLLLPSCAAFLLLLTLLPCPKYLNPSDVCPCRYSDCLLQSFAPGHA
jgi:hypothetical protein